MKSGERAEIDPGFFEWIADPDKLAELERVAFLMRANFPRTEGFSRAERDGKHILALLMKRTFRIENGRCELAGEDEQEMLMMDEVPYDRTVESPRSSPPLFMNDYVAVKRKTDVVVQGIAFAPEPTARRCEVSLRCDAIERRIAVFGPRFGELDRAGRPRFSEPSTFEAVPLRYDFAFGGVDFDHLLAPYADLPDDADVELPPISDAHYPRNPCGKGYLIELTPERFEGLALPSLEDPDDPLTPERLAVGRPERWLRAPLPACWDWQSAAWFPRAGYLGLTPEVEGGVVPAEVKRGWAASDILTIPPVHQHPDRTLRIELTQAASPGLAVERLAPDASFEIRGMHPRRQRVAFRLPGEVPEAQLELSPGVLSSLEPHLDSVVVRPHRGEVVMLWSMRAVVPRRYTDEELGLLRRVVSFRSVRAGER
ncbi:putative exported protein [Minicystis rosea]|nr:putative exported protein [Minicystis rosea]